MTKKFVSKMTSWERQELDMRLRKEAIKKSLEPGVWFYRKDHDPRDKNLKYFILGKRKVRNRTSYYIASFYSLSDLKYPWGLYRSSVKTMKILFEGGFIPGGKFPMLKA